MTRTVYEMSGLAAPPHTVIPFTPDVLVPRTTTVYTSEHYPLQPNEAAAIYGQVRRIAGPEPRGVGRPAEGGAHITSFGGALQTGAIKDETACGMRLLADPVRGTAVLAADHNPAAASLASQLFMRTLANTKPSKLVDSYGALHALTTAHDRIAGSASSAQFAGLQLLYGNRLAFVRNQPNLDLFIARPDSWCKKQSASGTNGNRAIISLHPGTQVLVLAPSHTKATDITRCMEEVDLSDPVAATIIASRLVTERVDNEQDGGTVVLVVHAKEWVDARPRWQRVADVARLSTAAYALVARGSGLKRRQFYEQPSNRGRLGKLLARTLDTATSVAGLYALFTLGRTGLSSWGIIDHNTYLEEALGHKMPTLQYIEDPPVAIKPPLQTAPEIDVNLVPPAPENPAQLPPHSLPNYDTLRTAFSTDTSTGQQPARASNLSDWSRDDIADMGHRASLPGPDIAQLQHDEQLVERIIEGYRLDNPAISADRMLNAGDAYHTGTGRIIADRAVLDFAAQHHLPPPQPATPPVTIEHPIPPPPKAAGLSPPSEGYSEGYVWPIVGWAGVVWAGIAGVLALSRRRQLRLANEQAQAELEGSARTHNRKKRRKIDKYTKKRPPLVPQQPGPRKIDWTQDY